MSTSPITRATVALITALVLGSAACGGDAADDAGDAGDAAGSTTMRVYTVPEALETDTDDSVHVSGLLIDDGSGWRLCELALESYPPQCGGETLDVEGLDESEYPVEEARGVRWVDGATVVGEVDGTTITVTGSPASS